MASTSHYCYHVTCGVSKKNIQSTRQTLRTDIQNTFNITGVPYTLQLCNADFNDWVEVEDWADLDGMDKCKLLVVLS